MKSIQPGRGPSMMGAAGAVFAVIFGIIWTFAAAGMGAPFFFPLFGLVFIGMGIASAVYHFKNATGKNRYSAYDIVDAHEEPDPLNQTFGRPEVSAPAETPDGTASNAFRFCPYCGMEVEPEFTFCPRCGKQLPDSQ